ncbi:MAG: ChbG/HpnK family deacetylase [Acidimicrobiales bacterium]
METLVERLGHRSDARLLIVSCDRIGTTHSATAGGYQALRRGIGTTATIVMPGPWSRHAAAEYRGEDIGVHLTLNAELDCYRWGPLTSAPSLLDGDGGFPRTVHDLWDHADLDEVRRECRAQIERAVLWGFDVSHLTTHMGALQQRPEFFDVLLDLAVEFALPARLESADVEAAAGFPFRRLAAEEGIVSPDHFRLVRGGARAHAERVLADLQPGVTEIALAPALDAAEQRAIDPDAEGRADDLAFALGRELSTAIERLGVTTTGYRELRSVQRQLSGG